MGLDYVARCQKCQRIVTWMSQSLEEHNKKYLAKQIAECVRDGLSVERMERKGLPSAAEFGHADDCPSNPPDNRKKRRDKRRDSRQREFI